MADAQHQNHQLIILDVVDDAVVTDADAELAVTATQLQTTRRTRILREGFDRYLQACGNLRVKPAKRLRSSPRDGDPVGHVSPRSKPELFHEVVERNTRLVARSNRRTDVGLILQRFERTIEELR